MKWDSSHCAPSYVRYFYSHSNFLSKSYIYPQHTVTSALTPAIYGSESPATYLLLPSKNPPLKIPPLPTMHPPATLDFTARKRSKSWKRKYILRQNLKWHGWFIALGQEHWFPSCLCCSVSKLAQDAPLPNWKYHIRNPTAIAQNSCSKYSIVRYQVWTAPHKMVFEVIQLYCTVGLM